MANISDLEIIQISTIEGNLMATVSYQNLDEVNDLNNGYNTMYVPINPREIQLSVRGNPLVNQSLKSQDEAAYLPPKPTE